jgi:hypothetical protein
MLNSDGIYGGVMTSAKEYALVRTLRQNNAADFNGVQRCALKYRA